MKIETQIPKKVAAALFVLALSPALALASNAKVRTERGIIASVDTNANTLIVREHHMKVERTFSWNDHTNFAEHNKAVNADALKVGEHVRLSFAPGSEVPNLLSVHITPQKASKHSATNQSNAGNNGAQMRLTTKKAGPAANGTAA